MPDYRLYRMDPYSGHIDGVDEFAAPDDAAAIALAERRAGRIPLELWRESRKLRRIDALPEMAATVSAVAPTPEPEPLVRA